MLDEAVNDDSTFEPFKVFEYDHDRGNYCLMLSGSDMAKVEETFEDNGRVGGGYAWADVALQAIRLEDPDLESKMQMDPEAGMFVAYGTDLEALQKLAGLLFDAFHDADTLTDLIKDAPFEWD